MTDIPRFIAAVFVSNCCSQVKYAKLQTKVLKQFPLFSNEVYGELSEANRMLSFYGELEPIVQQGTAHR